MNCSQANQLDINTFMNKLGIKGRPQGKYLTRYFSPFRPDKEPSFFVYADSNRWHDFGTGENGDLVTLVQKMYSCNTSQALEILTKNTPAKPELPFFSMEQKTFKKYSEKDQNFTDVSIQPIKANSIINYIHSRGINRTIWSKQNNLFQIRYSNCRDNKRVQYFTNLAWQNDTGGFEIRGTGKFKSSFGSKDITTIRGTGTDLNLFEGFFDYLSALVYFKTTRLKNTTIILNSLSNIKKVRPEIEAATAVNLFLDNDPAGIGAANNLQAKFGNCFNRSQQYFPEYHDFNDFLIQAKKINQAAKK